MLPGFSALMAGGRAYWYQVTRVDRVLGGLRRRIMVGRGGIAVWQTWGLKPVRFTWDERGRYTTGNSAAFRMRGGW